MSKPLSLKLQDEMFSETDTARELRRYAKK